MRRKKLLCALSVCDLIGAVYEGVHISVDLEETKSLALVRYGTPKVLPNDDVPCSPDVCVEVRLCQVRKFWVTNFQAKKDGRADRQASRRVGGEATLILVATSIGMNFLLSIALMILSAALRMMLSSISLRCTRT